MVLCNPFLGNGALNTPLRQQSYCLKQYFLLGPCKDVSRKGISVFVTQEPVPRRGRIPPLWALRVVGGDEKGSLKSERVKYGCESQGTRAWERLRWQGPTACTNNRHVFSSERSPHKNKTVTVKLINIWSWAPDGARRQDLLTDWPSVAMWLWLRLFVREITFVKEGSNTSTVALRDVGGDKKETQCLGL
jgi:hypothetical protein